MVTWRKFENIKTTIEQEVNGSAGSNKNHRENVNNSDRECPLVGANLPVETCSPIIVNQKKKKKKSNYREANGAARIHVPFLPYYLSANCSLNFFNFSMTKYDIRQICCSWSWLRVARIFRGLSHILARFVDGGADSDN